MKISICMPVFNRPKQLFEAIASILMQGYEDVELVIQDGAPHHAAADDPRVAQILGVLGRRVKYHAELDRGITDAINMCLRRTTGEVLYLMCSDDLLCPGALIAANAAFERERFGGPYWVYGQTVSAHESGRTQGIDGILTTYDQMLEHNRLGQPAVFWNRGMMELAGMFDTRYRYACDYDLWLRFWRVREPEFIPQTLGVFRHHETQATELHRTEVEREAAAIGRRHRSLGPIIDRARRSLRTQQVYPNGFPESVN